MTHVLTVIYSTIYSSIRIPMLGLALVLALNSCTSNRLSDCADQPDALALRSVLQVANAEGETSSGVVIGSDRILTVAHAIGNKPTITVAGKKRPARVIKLDPVLDLALLEAATGTLPALPLDHTAATNQQTLWAVGFPLGLQQRASMGLLKHQTPDHLYASVHINKGSSGGSLLRCEAGKFVLAGIVRGYLAHDDGRNLINTGDSVSVPSAAVKRFLAQPRHAQIAQRL